MPEGQDNDDDGTGMEAGIALGISLGLAMGLHTDNLALWFPLGIGIGLAVGGWWEKR